MRDIDLACTLSTKWSRIPHSQRRYVEIRHDSQRLDFISTDVTKLRQYIRVVYWALLGIRRSSLFCFAFYQALTRIITRPSFLLPPYRTVPYRHVISWICHTSVKATGDIVATTWMQQLLDEHLRIATLFPTSNPPPSRQAGSRTTEQNRTEQNY